MDNKIVSSKVKFLKKCILELTEFLEMGKDKFCDNSRNIAAAQTYIYGAVQTSINLAASLVELLNLGKYCTYRELFELLCKNGKLSPENFDKYIKMIETKNMIMFNYYDITGEKIYEILNQELPSYTMFLKDLKRNY